MKAQGLLFIVHSFLAASTVAQEDEWFIQKGFNACPAAIPGHSELHSSTKTLEECKSQCDANESCVVFTWNEAVPPHHCFWCYDATYAGKHNDHCISGCQRSGAKASKGCPASPAPPPKMVPGWTGMLPSQSNKSAGLPLIPNATHILVYNATAPNGERNPFGTYNHGPILTFFEEKYWMSWYNSPNDESSYMRSVYATSDDGIHWSAPQVLFTNLTHNGQENGPWTLINGRLYTQSGDQDAGLHIESIIGLMRRVDSSGLGVPFWLNDTVPECCKDWGFKTYLDMDDTTRNDAAQFLQSAVRTLIGVEDEMQYNERSLYMVPGTRTIVNLLRGARPHNLTATTCELPIPSQGLAKDGTSFSCRPGVGDVFYNLVEIVNLANGTESVEPRTCNWSSPVLTTIPDSHSRTCAAPFPSSGAIYLVGNQLLWGSRDPVTLAIAQDGWNFNSHFAVRAGAPDVKYPGHAKGKGFQYPGAAVVGDRMLVSYSIGKEDIGVTIFPLSSIGQQPMRAT